MLVGDLRRGADLYGDPTGRSRAQGAARPGDPRQPLLGRRRRRRDSAGPSTPTDPGDPAYDWALYDRTVDYAAQYGIKVLFSICGTPGWANGGQAEPSRRRTHADLQQLRLRGGEALQRHATRPRRPARSRRCGSGSAWNEPNNPVFLTPQYREGRRQVGDPERDRLREDLQRGLRRRARDAARGREGRVRRRPRPRGNNNPTQRAAVGLAARVPARR